MHKLFLSLLVATVSSMGAFAQNTFSLSSSSIGGQATTLQEFNGFGCTGENQSPQLSWSNAPAGTKSFAVTMYDPDAPTGSGWWHWLVFDIDPATKSLQANAGNPAAGLMPAGAIQSVTNYGTPGYGGPCPPEDHGWHTYIITVYALKTDKLGLGTDTNPAVVGYNLWANTIEKASIVAYYKR